MKRSPGVDVCEATAASTHGGLHGVALVHPVIPHALLRHHWLSRRV